MWRQLDHLEAPFVIPLIVLAGFSLAVIGSINSALATQQLVFFILGAILFIAFFLFDHTIFKSLGWQLYAIIIIMLALSFLGPSVRGSTRWLDIFGFRLQPSEFVKPLFLIVQAAFLVRFPLKTFKHIVFFFAIFLLPAFLVFKQPDLGNSLVYIGTTIALAFVGGMPLRVFLGAGVISIISMPLIWNVLKEYQRLRILTFLEPQFDAAGAGYNAIQAMIAVGSGEIFGRGLGRGSQSQLRFLPENHTDFIFASLSEELGFIAGSMVLVMYFLLLIVLLHRSRTTEDSFSRYLIVGCFAQLFLHSVINIGMNIGLLPITGITLPFLSYGGSSILSFSIMMGMAARAMKRKRSSTIAIS